MGTLGTTVVVSAPNNQPLRESSLQTVMDNSLLSLTQVSGKSELLTEIEIVAEKYGISKYYFYELAKKESSLNHYENGKLHCGDKNNVSCGLYQFQQPTWDENCEGLRTNIHDQIQCAAKLISIGQLWRWKNAATLIGWLK